MSTGHSQLQFLASPEVTGSNSIAIIQGIVQAGDNVPLHSHADPECFYVLDGEMEIYQDRNGSHEWTLVKKGSLAITHSNVKHAWQNQSSGPCVCLVITGADVFKFLHDFSEMQQFAMREGNSRQELMPKILKLAAETRGWIATLQENEAIGLKLR
jgi:quercetin dioxygenase-like cupin family protein